MGSAANGNDIRNTITRDIANRDRLNGGATSIEHLTTPSRGLQRRAALVACIDRQGGPVAGRLRGIARTKYDFITAITIEVGSRQGMTTAVALIDHATLPVGRPIATAGEHR